MRRNNFYQEVVANAQKIKLTLSKRHLDHIHNRGLFSDHSYESHVAFEIDNNKFPDISSSNHPEVFLGKGFLKIYS